MVMKKFFSRITLFPLLTLVLVFVMIYLYITQPSSAGQGSWMIALMVLPVLAVMIVVDLVLRKTFPVKTYWIWLIEILLLLVAIYAWIIRE
jgi:hypothetical protein